MSPPESSEFIPHYRLPDIRPYLNKVRCAILGKGKPRSSPLRYQDWEVEEKLGSSDRYTDYRAKKAKMEGCKVRLRVYNIDPYLDSQERESQRKLISNAFQAVSQIPAHSHILGARDFFEAEDGDSFVLVTDDIPASSLRQIINRQNLSLEGKFEIMRQVLAALDCSHKHQVIHRHITPDNILIDAEGQSRLAGFDCARLSSRSTTIAHDIVDDIEEDAVYQATECYRDPSRASIGSDLFAAGLVFYELLTGKSAFTTPEQICDRAGIFPTKASRIQPELSADLDDWLQTLCAFEPQNRFDSATEALQKLPSIQTGSADLTSLTPGSAIDDRYQIIERLGNPGSFAVAYKVKDSLSDEIVVLKLVTRDRHSVYDRLRQEYKTLRQLPPHPHVVRVISAEVKRNPPFVTFEYVEGQDIESLIADRQLSLAQAIQIASETAKGLAHLHSHGVYHQDIKPSNLLFTASGVRIIDFNVAVSNGETANAGTRRYLPPEFKPTSEPTDTQKRDRDLYALGITFYECVTGCHPFDEPWRDPRKILEREDLSAELVNLLLKAISPQPSARFGSAGELLEAIANITTPRQTEPQLVKTDRETLPLVAEDKSEYLFDKLDSLPQPSDPKALTSSKSVVLDPAGLYDIPPGYIAIATEVEWMRSFFVADGRYWVKGKRLCDWASEWLRAWNRTDAIAQIKQSPRARLTQLFHPVPIPEQWDDRQLLDLADRLDYYPPERPIAYLLAEIVGTEPIWLQEPSIEHLAAWLAVPVPEECKLLERVWQHGFADSRLSSYYLTEDKSTLLRQWLGIAEPEMTELGKYPLPVPDFIAPEFDRYWEERLYRSEGEVIDKISGDRSGMERIADIAYQVFRNRPQLITKVREAKLAAYLNRQQLIDLRDRQPPSPPQPLSLEANPQQALNWATEQYLPYRRWEVLYANSQQLGDRSADNFAQWLLERYPEMLRELVEESALNYSVTSLVKKLSQESPVLWVVIEGLGWLDLQELSSLLTEKQRLKVDSLQPRFSLLPAATQYAKWSLYAQYSPNSPDWREIDRAFSSIGTGERYTDLDIDKLHRDLQGQTHSLYCWESDRLSRLYRDRRDWRTLYRLNRPDTLRSIANEIDYCCQQYPVSSALTIVISSDRGQMLGKPTRTISCPPELQPQGRMAIGKTDDPNFAILDRDTFSLPHDISIVKGSASLDTFSYSAKREAIDLEGGILPEEVVLGFAILRQSVARTPVLVSCRGEGKSQEAGKLEITIDNPNAVPLIDLCLYIGELPILSSGYPLDLAIPANNKVFYQIDIPKSPELPPTHQGKELSLSGEVKFRYANSEAGSAPIDPQSTFSIEQIFSSGLDIDEFF